MTSSIVAHDPNSGAVAVAVATKAFAVGGFLLVRAGVGAVPSDAATWSAPDDSASTRNGSGLAR
jgi:uncharacterized Ntn-hydrolase superfamily protein